MSKHVTPIGDSRDHVTNGDPCPCMPLEHDGALIHNSYDGRELPAVCLEALDAIALALTDHSHTWSDDERWKYERAVHVIQMHMPDRDAEHQVPGVVNE